MFSQLIIIDVISYYNPISVQNNVTFLKIWNIRES